MTDEELDALLEAFERALVPVVQAQLDEVSDEFTESVDRATELVAAAFSVSSIREMWNRRIPRIMTPLRGIFRRAAADTAESLDEPVPSDAALDDAVTAYGDAVQPLLRTVGDNLAAEAQRTLAEGVNEGESLDQLKSRMRQAFSDTSAQLGPVRADRIAQTEAVRAYNAGILAAAEAIEGPDKPLVKQWVTRHDNKVRAPHAAADGQIQLLGDPFDVGGTAMQYPGDPTAPPSLTINCRCVLKTAAPARPAADVAAAGNLVAEPTEGITTMTDDGADLASRMPPQLKAYWLTGPGAAKIGWGTPGSFDRCVRALRDDFPQDPEGLCANLYKDATGHWPGEKNEGESVELDGTEEAPAGLPAVATWSTPDGDALAYENQQTGDGRVIQPGALYWNGPGPWPLMANENFDSHDDAALAGAIYRMDRDGDRLDSDGVLYLTQDVGLEAAMLLAQGAPLGVSVDLDDVDVEMVDAKGGAGDVYRGRLVRASVLPSPDGGFTLAGETAPRMTAAGSSLVTESQKMRFHVGPDGTVPSEAFDLVAAAGDPDVADGVVLDAQHSGEYLMRITRARVRGATLVTIPAYAGARITLDSPELICPPMDEGYDLAAAVRSESDYDRVLRHVRSSKSPVGAARVAQSLKMPIVAAQRLLALAASRGEVVKLTRGLYTDATTSAKADHVMYDDMVASVTGAVDLPVASRELEWDGDAATGRVFEWADGDVDKLSQAYAYRDDEADPATKAAYKLGYADVIDGRLTIVPRGVFAAEAAVNGARGGVDIPADQLGAVRERLASVRAHVDEETGGEEMDGMQASAWAALSDLPAMPAAWFREPTADELPPGGAGVNYSGGRIFGWVAQADEPHAGYAKRVVINDLGRIDTTHFLRQRFTLDDGSTVKAGAFTMNAGHHRDGAECETSACQFDDTRTVAGIVTVGMNERGMWFSGAAAPWLSEWDRSVFMATQPSYHLKRGPRGDWQLRAVLAVPVPGHSSPLLASAVVERAQVALTAAAMMAEVEEAVSAAVAAEMLGEDPEPVAGEFAIDYDRLADAMVASLARAEDRRKAEQAELEALLSEARRMGGDTAV